MQIISVYSSETLPLCFSLRLYLFEEWAPAPDFLAALATGLRGGGSVPLVFGCPSNNSNNLIIAPKM